MTRTNLNKVGIEAHQTAVEKGWYDDGGISVGEAIALFHSELSEALEEYRSNHPPAEVYHSEHVPDCAVSHWWAGWGELTFDDGELYAGPERGFRIDPDLAPACSNDGCKPEGFPIEIADAVIRIAEYCVGRLGIDLDGAIDIKRRYNDTRPRPHGGKVI